MMHSRAEINQSIIIAVAGLFFSSWKWQKPIVPAGVIIVDG